MKSIVHALPSLLALLAIFAGAPHPAAIYAASQDPVVSLTVTNRPLGEALDAISRDTGVRFRLDPRWRDHPVSANIQALPLEKALKRLLRSLNHTIIWHSEETIAIMVFGESEQGGADNAVSFAAPPQEVPEDPEPFDDAGDPDENEPEEASEGDDGGADAESIPNPSVEATEMEVAE